MTTMSAPKKSAAADVCRVMLVDDHPIVRRGLATTYEAAPDITVCAEAEGIRDTMEMIVAVRPDVLVLDIGLKDGNGLDLIKRVRGALPGIRILVSSMHEEWLFAERAVMAGALGYINKDQPAERMIDAVRAVHQGRVYLSEAMTERLVTRQTAGAPDGDGSPIQRLTDRELEVFEMLGRGYATRNIAESLRISVKTVETHRENLKRKLGLSGTNALIRQAVEWRIMPHASPGPVDAEPAVGRA